MTGHTLRKVAFWTVAVLFVLSVPVFLVTGSVTWAFNNPGLYNQGFEKYNVSLYTGISDADLRQAGADIRRYFNSGDEPLVVRTRVFGQEQEIFNQREVDHMRDVKVLVRRVYLLAGLSGLYILSVAVVGLVWLKKPFVDTLARFLLWGGVVTLAFLLVMGLFAATGFNTLFLKFHQLSFSNDFWQLDPHRDYLVMMFPIGFWFDATIRVAATALGGALVLSSASGAYLLYRYWRARSGSGQQDQGVGLGAAPSSGSTPD